MVASWDSLVFSCGYLDAVKGARSFFERPGFFVISWIIYGILGGNEGTMWKVFRSEYLVLFTQLVCQMEAIMH